jgi:hypothetical protein
MIGSMTNNDLRPPSEWESHDGIRIADRTVFESETKPISYEEFRHITEDLTVSKIPKSD